jgi:uncharacterized protein YkwD
MANIDFEELSRSILIEHNRLRQDPQSFIPILKEHMKYFKDLTLYLPNSIPLVTQEGSKAYEDAILFLQKQQPLEVLTFDEKLAKAAELHVKDIGPKGALTHESSDGKSVSDRIELFCQWETACAENIDLGAKKGIDVLISLLVDDGIPSRGHRANLFKSNFKFVGVACGVHKEYEVVSVIDYTGGIRDLNKPFFDYKNYKYQYPEEFNGFYKDKKKKEVRPKTPYQIQDEDAPDKTVSVRIIKKDKEFDGRKISITQKIYTLEDGTQHIVELEEF